MHAYIQTYILRTYSSDKQNRKFARLHRNLEVRFQTLLLYLFLTELEADGFLELREEPSVLVLREHRTEELR